MRWRGSDPDATLAAAAAAGDAAAFAELYDRHVRAIYGYCRRVLRSAEEAADATHEAFVSVLERLRGTHRPIVAPRAYLFRAAHNACLRIADRRLDSAPEPEAGPASDGDLSDTERIVFTRELQDEVRAANDELSLRQREILALREVEHLRYDEIARIMGTTPNAAAQLAWRARARLRTCLRRRAFDAIVLQTLDCERALGLLELAEDAGALSPDEDIWLARHFAACPRCASNRAVLAEVGATYRSWVPAGAGVPLLTVALLQRAGEVVGASWGAGAGAGAGGAAAGAGGGATHAAVTAGAVAGTGGGGAAAAAVPTALVVAALGLGGGSSSSSAHHVTAPQRAALPRPPAALVASAVPVRAPKLSSAPAFKVKAPAPAPRPTITPEPPTQETVPAPTPAAAVMVAAAPTPEPPPAPAPVPAPEPPAPVPAPTDPTPATLEDPPPATEQPRLPAAGLPRKLPDSRISVIPAAQPVIEAVREPQRPTIELPVAPPGQAKKTSVPTAPTPPTPDISVPAPPKALPRPAVPAPGLIKRTLPEIAAGEARRVTPPSPG